MQAISGRYAFEHAALVQDLNSFAKGTELFRNGLLSEARLALEAEVQRQPGNVEAWRLLGTVHAENDNDQQVSIVTIHPCRIYSCNCRVC